MLLIHYILVDSLLACTAGSFLVCFSAQCVSERHPRTRSNEKMCKVNGEFFFCSRFSFCEAVSLTLRTAFNTNPVRNTNEKHIENCQLRKGALHPGLSSRDITEQLDRKGGGLVTSSRATILHSQVTKKWYNYWPLISTMCLDDLCAAINSLGDPAVS